MLQIRRDTDCCRKPRTHYLQSELVGDKTPIQTPPPQQAEAHRCDTSSLKPLKHPSLQGFTPHSWLRKRAAGKDGSVCRERKRGFVNSFIPKFAFSALWFLTEVLLDENTEVGSSISPFLSPVSKCGPRTPEG